MIGDPDRSCPLLGFRISGPSLLHIHPESRFFVRGLKNGEVRYRSGPSGVGICERAAVKGELLARMNPTQ